MNKILSISIAAYNAEKFLPKCLDSFCVPEIMEDIEVLIVNDGSTDRTPEIAAEYVSKYPNTFVLINKENGGHGSTINTGIKTATGKYFKLVDADDWVDKTGLVDLVKKAAQCSVDAIISPYYKFFMSSNDMRLHTPFLSETKYNDFADCELKIEKISELCEFHLAALTFRTNILKDHFTAITEKCFFVDMEYDAFYSCYISDALLSSVPVYVYRLENEGQSVIPQNMVSRRDQHFEVYKRMVEFYNNVSGTVSEANLHIVKRLIAFTFSVQTRILLTISDKYESEKELHSFIKYTKTNNPSLYRDVIRCGIKEKMKPIMISVVLDKTNFLLFGFVYKMFRLFKHTGS